MMQQVRENALVARLRALLPHCPSQVNGLHESDAEIIRLPGPQGQMLAITTDSLVEEIESGLYTEPYLAGWMTVMANLSDLAAVGAEPLGVLIAETLPRGMSDADITALQCGIRDACLHAGTCILGGDTNSSDRLHTTGTAVGLISDGTPLLRVRCLPGEALYCTGAMGIGNAYAALRVLNEHGHVLYRPSARLCEGRSLRSCASICMDTSDGLFSTLDQLGRLNRCGFHLTRPLEEFIAPEALRVAGAMGLSPWMLLAAPHGEFELVFTVPLDRIPKLEHIAERAGWTPIRIGITTREPGIAIHNWGTLSPDDLASIRNYPMHSSSERLDFPRFLAALEAGRKKTTKQ